MVQDRHWIADAPADAGVRERLVAAAGEHFSRVGFEKATLTEVASSLGFSKSYFYKFFGSKQEVGDAVCSQCLNRILVEVEREVGRASSDTERLRALLRTIPIMSLRLRSEDRGLFGMAAISCAENWASFTRYLAAVRTRLEEILASGRANGEFERKTPLDEITRAILLSMHQLIDPRVLQHHADFVSDGSNDVIGLILRSLAP